MPWLRLALLPVMLYVLADFASPYVDGVLSFEMDDCVEGVHSERLRASVERAAMPPRPTSCALERPAHEDLTARRDVTASVRHPGISVRDRRHTRSDLGAPADDH